MPGSPAVAAPPPAASTDAEDTDWAAEYAELKKRFKRLQEDTLSLANSYENACEELLEEEERRTILVRKLAEIRVRRMNMFLRVPENGRMLFMEESRAAMRRRYPLVPRREIKRLLEDQWEVLTDKEQQEWDAKFQTLLKNAAMEMEVAKPSRRKSNARTSSTKKPQARISKPPVVKAPTPKAVKRKAPPADAIASAPETAKKRKTQAVKKEPTDRANGGADNSVTPAKSPAMKTTKKPATSKPKTKPKTKAAIPKDSETPTKAPSKSTKKTSTNADKPEDPVPSGEPVSTPPKQRSSPAKPKKTPTPRPKKTSPAKKTPPKSSPKPRKKPTPTKRAKQLASDEDDDDDDGVDNDDDDDDDEDEDNSRVKRRLDDDSGSSEDDDDDDRRLAQQLPTGAFG